MKRNMNLARDILFQLEQKNNPLEPLVYKSSEYSEIEVSYHIKLLYEARLLHAIDASSKGNLSWMAMHLTWEGHEFIDLSRNEKIWKRVLSIAKSKGGGLAFDILKPLLIKAAESN